MKANSVSTVNFSPIHLRIFHHFDMIVRFDPLAYLVGRVHLKQVEWVVPLDEEGGPVVAMEWRVEVEAVVVGRSGGQVEPRSTPTCLD